MWHFCLRVDIVSREDSMSLDARGTNDVKLGFRFTQPTFDINRYDQIWFFGDQPNQTDGSDEGRLVQRGWDHGGDGTSPGAGHEAIRACQRLRRKSRESRPRRV
jgi:hypothetical protein